MAQRVFTPTVPITMNVVVASTNDAATCKLKWYTLRTEPGEHLAIDGELANYDSGPTLIDGSDKAFSIQDVDGDTPIADALAAITDGVDSVQQAIEDMIFSLLQTENNPATGSPWLPAGTVA